MNPAHCLRSLLLGGLIAASLIGATPASAQYFGPFGFRPGFGVGLGPGVAIGAIPRWSRRPPIYASPFAPLYPPIGYRAPVLVAPVLPALPLPPAPSYRYAEPASVFPADTGSRISIGLGHVDIQVPGFSYQARRGVVPPPVDYPMPPSALQYSSPPTAGDLGHPASRLANALAQREDGEIWLDYLQPERLAMSDNPAEIDELALRYQGVMANPDLAWLQRLDGFNETVAWLSQTPVFPDVPAPSSLPMRPDTAVPQEDFPVAKPATPLPGEPTLAPSLPEDESQEQREESSSVEALPAPSPEPTTSL